MLVKLGARLKQVRLEKGYTNYEKFAYEKGLSRSQYGSYESGKNITFIVLMRLLDCLDISVSEFFSQGFE